MTIRFATIAVALMCAGCGSNASSPSSPTPTPTPAPSSQNAWTVTQSLVSVVGPDNCWVQEQRARWTGAVFPDLPMTIMRSGGSITLESGFFAVNFAGTFSGNDFTATGVTPLPGGGSPCKDGTSFQQLPGVSNLSGRFSVDDQLVTANEVNTYRLTSGETVTYTWGWEAKRKN
jgi:hypothetical protein